MTARPDDAVFEDAYARFLTQKRIVDPMTGLARVPALPDAMFPGATRSPLDDVPPGETNLRWRAEITYRTASGPMVLDVQVEEIEDVAAAVAEGPDWRCIADIRISLCRSADAFSSLVLPLRDSQEDGA